jgi:hypothetical protein
VFPLDEAAEAHMKANTYFGKIVLAAERSARQTEQRGPIT